MKAGFCFLACLIAFQVNAQTVSVPMEPAFWEFDSTMVQFVKQGNTTAVKPKGNNGYQIFLKNHSFTDGTIEYDVELTGTGFPGIIFRMTADRKNGENFYIRSFGKQNALARTTLQYAAILDGTSMWDLSDAYQAGANINQPGLNHVKLVISGKQMLAYVNDMAKPALQIPEMESRVASGGISFTGNVMYSNFKMKPGVTEGLSPAAGIDITANDTRYLRKWQVTEPVDFPFGKDIVLPLPSAFGTLKQSDLPDSSADWKPIQAEDRSVVNLNRIYGSGKPDQRRLAWMRTTIHSDKDQDRILHLGFSDEIWVFINGQILYVDKNYFGTPEQKEPRGRCTIDNTSVKLPLRQGDNTIMIALANYFYGWGIVARLDSVDGLDY